MTLPENLPEQKDVARISRQWQVVLGIRVSLLKNE